LCDHGAFLELTLIRYAQKRQTRKANDITSRCKICQLKTAYPSGAPKFTSGF